jgi:hypothetical protein
MEILTYPMKSYQLIMIDPNGHQTVCVTKKINNNYDMIIRITTEPVINKKLTLEYILQNIELSIFDNSNQCNFFIDTTYRKINNTIQIDEISLWLMLNMINDMNNECIKDNVMTCIDCMDIDNYSLIIG